MRSGKYPCIVQAVLLLNDHNLWTYKICANKIEILLVTCCCVTSFCIIKKDFLNSYVSFADIDMCRDCSDGYSYSKASFCVVSSQVSL